MSGERRLDRVTTGCGGYAPRRRCKGRNISVHASYGLHRPENLGAILLGINRKIKKDGFDLNWSEPPHGDTFRFEFPDNGDSEIPF